MMDKINHPKDITSSAIQEYYEAQLNMYLIAKGVRLLAFACFREEDSRPENRFKTPKGILKSHEVRTLTFPHPWLSRNGLEVVIYYRAGYQHLAVDFARTFSTKPLDHKKIGYLLGYPQDIAGIMESGEDYNENY